MFLISITYTASLDVLDSYRAAHREWLDQGIAEGWLLLAGPREPREGGVLLARGTRAELQEKAAGDPFFVNNVATFELIEFVPVKAAPGTTLESLLA